MLSIATASLDTTNLSKRIMGGILYESGTLQNIRSRSYKQIWAQISLCTSKEINPGAITHISAMAEIRGKDSSGLYFSHCHHRYNWILRDVIENYPTIDTDVLSANCWDWGGHIGMTPTEDVLMGLCDREFTSIDTPSSRPVLRLIFWLRLDRTAACEGSWNFKVDPKCTATVVYDIENDELWFVDSMRGRYLIAKLSPEDREYFDSHIPSQLDKLDYLI